MMNLFLPAREADPVVSYEIWRSPKLGVRVRVRLRDDRVIAAVMILPDEEIDWHSLPLLEWPNVLDMDRDWQADIRLKEWINHNRAYFESVQIAE